MGLIIELDWEVSNGAGCIGNLPDVQRFLLLYVLDISGIGKEGRPSN